MCALARCVEFYAGCPLTALQAGLRTFQAHLRHDALTRRRIEIAAMAFDSDVRVVQDFVTAEQFIPPMLTAQGLTRMGLAIHQALDMLQRRKAQYCVNGVTCYRPWILMITDGEPQGESERIVEAAARRIKEDEARKQVVFFAVGVENADMKRLARIVERPPRKLKGLNFIDMFIWRSPVCTLWPNPLLTSSSCCHRRTGDRVMHMLQAGRSVVW